MKLLGKILFSLLFSITLVTQASAQTDKKHLITNVEIDLNIKDLTKDVTALYINCSLFVDSKKPNNSKVANGYVVLYDEGAYPTVIDTSKSPTISFIHVEGFPKSGVEQSISVNVFGLARAELWSSGECELAISNKNYSTYADWVKKIDLAFEENFTPLDCNVDSISPEHMHICVSPQSKANLSGVSFKRFGETPDTQKK